MPFTFLEWVQKSPRQVSIAEPTSVHDKDITEPELKSAARLVVKSVVKSGAQPAVKPVFIENKELTHLVLKLTWKCLETTKSTYKNPVYSLHLPDEGALRKLAYSRQLNFAPSLLKVLQAAAPPKLGFFTSLPQAPKGAWGVYAIVLEKEGSRPLVYIGSATSTFGGVHRRFQEYERFGDNVSDVMRQAVAAGYKITHKGCFVWTGMPGSGVLPVVRTMLVGFEATLSFVFWSMLSKRRDYSMAHMRHWPLELFEYDGLCTHSALIEAVAGRHDLSAEDREEYDMRLKQKRKENQHQHYVQGKAKDPDAWRADRAERARKWRENAPDKSRAVDKRRTQQAKDSQRWHCDVCDHSFAHERGMILHLAGKKHATKVALIADINISKPINQPARNVERDRKQQKKRYEERKLEYHKSKKYYCEICDHNFVKKAGLTAHLNGKKHAAKLAVKSAGGLSDDMFECSS